MSNACMTCLVTLLVGTFAKQIVEATTNGQGQQFDTKFVTYFACMRILVIYNLNTTFRWILLYEEIHFQTGHLLLE